jgi:hypothetical protein
MGLTTFFTSVCEVIVDFYYFDLLDMFSYYNSAMEFSYLLALLQFI